MDDKGLLVPRGDRAAVYRRLAGGLVGRLGIRIVSTAAPPGPTFPRHPGRIVRISLGVEGDHQGAECHKPLDLRIE